ncbi:uncharacterized protein LOC113309121 isoform X2 [Papaver somniferum]|uniref:uncharacterized protein LOC113309121 isoform X2 n=1 Tax=Papaver somniferum TaxID=3469 RepID=UPI000E701A77|nr:uncharacterized protein LOC113309121 isoform X2 [Papaver somniferum]
MQNREQVNMDIVVEDLPSFLKSFSTLQNLYQLEQHTVGDRKVDPPRRKLNLRISWDSNLSKSEEMSQTCKVFGVILWPPFQSCIQSIAGCKARPRLLNLFSFLSSGTAAIIVPKNCEFMEVVEYVKHAGKFVTLHALEESCSRE